MTRAAVPADADAIAAIHVAGWRAAYTGIMPAAFLANLSIPERAAGWRRGIERDSGMVQVFEEAGNIRGWIASGKARENGEAHEGEIYALYVDPSHWRCAIGGALIRHAEQKLWAEGFQSVVLWVLERNNLARAFYSKCGYAEDGESKTIDIAESKLVELRLIKIISER
ncbi:MAG: GNAT family N-acetyltransferase [Opitutaceae bacterium]|nr:GNAT family N-acetyltransferase [Opitutaceae bacterium]